jgi:ABC-2 type transport system permease protein
MTPVAALRKSSLAVESFLFAGRLLTHWRREPVMAIQALLYPTFLLIAYDLLVGKSILKITGRDSLYGLVPTCAVAGAMFGALAASMTIRVEREWGLLPRLWVLPVNRASALTGRLVAEAARTVVGSVLVTAVGVALGLRFEGGWLAVILFILVPVAVAVVFSTVLIAIAVRSTNSMTLILVGVFSISAVASTASNPVSQFHAVAPQKVTSFATSFFVCIHRHKRHRELVFVHCFTSCLRAFRLSLSRANFLSYASFVA